MIRGRDLDDLREAKEILENPGLGIRLMDFLGRPIQEGLKRLPAKAQKIVIEASRKSIEKAVEVAVHTMDTSTTRKSPSNFLHKLAVIFTGGLGGLGGLEVLPIELPITPVIMLRSILDVARSEGANLKDLRTRLDAVTVFSLGGPPDKDDEEVSSYYAVRHALAFEVERAVEYIAQKGIVDDGAPVILKLIQKVAQRFGVQVTEEIAAKAVPVIGSAGGAAINYIFIDHFQRMAKGHFVIRRLEARYGPEVVRNTYLRI